MRRLAGAFGLALSLCVIVPCSADVIVANNAGSTLATAEDLTGLVPTEIIGALNGSNPNDVSIFKFLAGANFSAMTVPVGAFGIPDTVLSLFNSNGVGIYLNDDISGGNTLSCLPSPGAGNPCPTTTALSLPVGVYYLAISESANYPIDQFGNEIFAPSQSTDLAGPVSTNPLAGWDGNSFTSPDTDLTNYDIVLTGTTPEPGYQLITALGLAAVLVLAKRRRGRPVIESAAAHSRPE